jgi:hypothetical protein
MIIAQTANIKRYLQGLTYPAYKKDLLSKAENLGADDRTMEMIFALPTRKYRSPMDINNAIKALSAVAA